MILLYSLQGLHVEYQEASGVHVVLKVCDLYTAGNGICLYPLYELLIRLMLNGLCSGILSNNSLTTGRM